ncbi:MAG: AsmA family protein [Bacteroidota bacterium]
MRKPAVITLAALGALALLAVAVPPMIDWSGTRDQIAQRIATATGRPVRIEGKLGLRLLPSPALAAEGLVIGNPAGMPGELARVERLRLKLALLPLLTGSVRVRSLELDHPVVTLARAGDGRANWSFDKGAKPAPAAETPARPTESAATKDETLPVSAVTIRDGVLQYGGLRLDAVDAEIMLGGRSGPFQGKGSARLGDTAVALDGAIDQLGEDHGSPARLSLSLPGEDAMLEVSGVVSRLSGGDTLRGKLSAKAANPARALARLGAAATLPPGPLSVTAELTASAEEVSLSGLDTALGEVHATGALSAALGAVPQVDVRLTVPTVNLDRWKQPEAAKSDSGAATSAPPTAPAPAAAKAGGFSLPRDIFVSAALGVDTLTWRGQDVRQAKLEAVLDGGELMLRQAAAKLPGATDTTAEGALTAENGQPVFDGTVRMKADNAAALLAWLGADTGAATRKAELTTPLRLAWPEIKLSDFRLTVDGVPARGNAALRLGDQPGLALTAALAGMEVMIKGRLAADKKIEDGAFKLASNQGLRPLRAFGVNAPPALDRLGTFTAEGAASGTADLFDIGNLSLRAGPNRIGGQVHADLRGAKPSITADLNADTLALDSLGAPERSGHLLPGGGMMLPPTLAPQPSAVVPAALVGAGASPFSREPLELSGLNAIDAKLALKAQTVTAKGWRLDNAVMQAAVQNGTATIERLTGRLLGGELNASAKLTAAATPALNGQLTIAGADLGAAKLSAAGLTISQGRMDADIRFATTGRSSQDMAARLDGDGKLLVRNGTLDGFDLPAVNRQMGNLRNLGSVLGVVQAGLSGGRTPFSQLAGTFRADNGVVVSRDLKLDAEGGGAHADTTVNLPDWSTRTTIAFHLANAPQTPITVRLEGPLENPRKIIDLNAIQQYMMSQGLGRTLGGDQQQQGDQPREKNTGKNILKNLLKGLGGQ